MQGLSLCTWEKYYGKKKNSFKERICIRSHNQSSDIHQSVYRTPGRQGFHTYAEKGPHSILPTYSWH